VGEKSDQNLKLSHAGAACRDRETIQASTHTPSIEDQLAVLPYPTTWRLISSIWPMEDRPDEMKDPLIVGTMDFKTALDFKRHHEELLAKQGKGDSVFGKDNDLPAKNFAAGSDNCNNILHEVRWERMPVSELKEYWKQIPPKRTHIYRRLPLEHHGAAGAVGECVIIRAHDRTLPLKICMFSKANSLKKSLGASETKGAADNWENPKAITDIMDALLNLNAVFFCLWHMDPTPSLLMRLVVYYNYAIYGDRSEKERARLIVEVIDAILRENSSRAIARDPPLSFRQCKERWKDIAERWGDFGGQGSSGMSTAPNKGKREPEKAGGRMSGPEKQRIGDGRGGNGPARFGNRSGTQARGRALRYLNNPICYKYNRATGCDRPRKTGGCDDGRGGIYAHVCNYENQQGVACHQQHCAETWRH